MRASIAYKNHVIICESFQRETPGLWVPQYHTTRQKLGSAGNDFPIQQYQLHEAFPTQDGADDFALQKAMDWIDKN
jgi:hypothetical protein